MKTKAMQAIPVVFLICAAVAVFYPIIYALSASMMTPSEIDSFPPKLFPSGLYLENYKQVFELLPVGRFLLNSFIVSISITLGHLITASLAAYAFAFLKFNGKVFIFTLFLLTMMIPWEVTMIPNFLNIRAWGWTDNYLGLIVPYLMTGFGTFLFRQFFLQLPYEIIEAAKVEGYGHVRIYLHIVTPLARPAFATLAVYSFIQAYNMYLWPLLITNSNEMRTVQLGITMLVSEDFTPWNYVLAGVSLMTLPPLLMLVFGLKQLVGNITVGSLKG